ncbi:hypothetical protein KGQ20_34815 [Catenulispora sp. NF23]|uniref:hypothetical protein n=1 Tax=Catenulispora pinistramenti TaxID=2705254 RepID=UPI001BAA2EAC|nr:hypothetical protein [Catenulispora pinistramenti]MBS2537938.1 hypothetical protein [Catenulispora pinistramenti]
MTDTLAEPQADSGSQTDPGTDGRHDFDFAFGRWRNKLRKLVDTTDPECTEWVEFEVVGEMRPILGGLGNFDTFVPVGLPEEDRFEGATLRLFDPATRLWRIWWMSSRHPGGIDVPVEGRFENGRGQFFCEEEIGGRPAIVRYEWFDLAPGSTRFEQAFSFDGGETWAMNWITTGTREDDASADVA